MGWGVGAGNNPETHRAGRDTGATAALMGGLAAMMFLDVTLG